MPKVTHSWHSEGPTRESDRQAQSISPCKVWNYSTQYTEELLLFKTSLLPGMVVYTCDPSGSEEAEAGGSQVWGQPRQLWEALSNLVGPGLKIKKIKRAGDVAQWLSAPGFNPWY